MSPLIISSIFGSVVVVLAGMGIAAGQRLGRRAPRDEGVGQPAMADAQCPVCGVRNSCGSGNGQHSGKKN